jgi:hypothetical protein
MQHSSLLPLFNRESKSLDFDNFDKRSLHLVKRTNAPLPAHAAEKRSSHHTKEIPHGESVKVELDDEYNDDVAVDKATQERRKRAGRNRLLETAVFLDAAAYNK